MTDNSTHATVVEGLVSPIVVERRLKYRSGKHNLIEKRIVVGVDRLGCHLPFAAVDRLTELGKIPFQVKAVCVQNILKVGSRFRIVVDNQGRSEERRVGK